MVVKADLPRLPIGRSLRKGRSRPQEFVTAKLRAERLGAVVRAVYKDDT
jgi:hypothetical protein